MADTKSCSKCKKAKALDEFDVDRSKPDGKHLWCHTCKRDYERARGPRAATKTRLVRNRARNRAAERLKDAHLDEFQRLYDEEYARALAEHDQLVAATADNPPTPHEHPAASPPAELRPAPTPTPHPAAGTPPPTLPRLLPGPAARGETRADRIRDDVGACPLCINRHDRGHTCPACGARPQITAPVTAPRRQFRVQAS